MTSSQFQLTGAEWLTRIGDDELGARVGDTALSRAWGYVEAERVNSINTGNRGSLVLATIEGNRADPYSTIITRTRDEPLAWTSRCSCPMNVDCKHVATLVLTAREVLGRSTERDSGSSWEQFARQFLGDTEEPLVETGTALGLRVVMTQRPHSVHDSRPRPAFELVPSKVSLSGRWASRLSWLDLQRDAVMGADRRFNRQHTSALSELVRMWQSARRTHLVAEPQIFLEDLGPGVWLALGQAIAAGVELLPPYDQPDAQVRWDREPLRPRAAFVPAEGGGLTGLLDLGIETQRAVLQGTPPHGAVIVEGRDLELRGFDSPLSPEAAWLHEHGPLEVAAADATHFVDRFGARLRDRGLLIDLGETKPDEPLRLQLIVRALSDDAVEAELAFRYPGGSLEPVGLGTRRFARDRPAERELVNRVEDDLREAGLLEPLGGLGWWPVPQNQFEGWRAIQLLNAIPQLEANDDLLVELEGELPAFEEAREAPRLSFGAVETDQADWLELNVTVTIDSEPVPFTPLYAALARGDEIFINPVTKTYFRLDHPDLITLRRLIDEARAMQDGKPKSGVHINRFQVGLWDELLELGVVDEQAQSWANRARTLVDPSTLEPPVVPRGLRADLRSYQLDGFGWLATLWDLKLGGILADDMGLGKTMQTLALLLRARERGELDRPVLVVAPSSVVGVWQREAATFAPDLDLAVIARTNAARGETVAQSMAGAQVVLTTYTVLRLEAEDFAAQDWRALVLDEAHTVKNHQSKTFQAAKRIGAEFTLAITGTPLENSLMDLWSMLSLSAPALYPRPDIFAREYRKPIGAGHAPELLESLRRRVRPLMLRRTKELVAADLPPKQVQVQQVALSPRHSAAYNRHLQRERQRILGLLQDPDANRVAILSSLSRLRMAALDPHLVEESYTANELSAKLAFLVDMVAEIRREGHRALVFSTFTSYLKMADQALADAGHLTSYLDGSMSSAQRVRVVNSFKEGDQAAFLISMKAGGTGLTLTEADYVFVLDPWWNPAAEEQAIDRAHRIGQDNPVMVYRLISEGTIEDKVRALQERKRELFESVIDSGGSADGVITPEDIRGLFD